MSNIEENLPGNNNNSGSGSDENVSNLGNTGSSNHGDSDQSGKKPLDPKHNTGHEHMRIDEEGSEIGPDDEV